MKAMKFKLPRDRTIASLCGLSIEFKKNEYHLVPPAMFAEVIAAGGVSEEELTDDEKPAGLTAPTDPAERQAALFKAFEAIVAKNDREEFTAGNSPHIKVLQAMLGWSVTPKERDTAWHKFSSGQD